MSKRLRRSPANSKDPDRYVVRVASGWAVRKLGAQVAPVYSTRVEAEEAAKIARGLGGCGFILGRDNFEKISAVEGIHLSDEMKRDFRNFDREGISGEKRRRALSSKYGKRVT